MATTRQKEAARRNLAKARRASAAARRISVFGTGVPSAARTISLAMMTGPGSATIASAPVSTAMKNLTS